MRFQPGDKVRLIERGGTSFPIGTILTVDCITYGNVYIMVEHPIYTFSDAWLQPVGDVLPSASKHYRVINKIKEIQRKRESMGYKWA
jgi:hypothetical protein